MLFGEEEEQRGWCARRRGACRTLVLVHLVLVYLVLVDGVVVVEELGADGGEADGRVGELPIWG